MSLRQKGRRIKKRTATIRSKAAKSNVPRRAAKRRNDSSGVGERRQLVRLLICCGIFVSLVISKILLPDYMETINRKISHAMTRNMDVQAVFSSVGKAFSGESKIGQFADEVYQAVFRAEEVVETASEIHVSVIENAQALDFLREYRVDSKEIFQETTQEKPDSLAYILYSNQTLPEGVSMEQALLGFDYCTPVSGSISSQFGYRDHPTEGEERFHYGIDLAADSGTDILCFADGTVTAVGESSSYGKYCMIAHENGYSTLYAHCSRVTVSSGSEVQRGDVVAEVGQTGMATGPHLHFELQRDGVYLNPIYYVSAN